MNHTDPLPDLDMMEDIEYFLKKYQDGMHKQHTIHDYQVICDQLPQDTPESAYDRAMKGL